MEKISKNNFKKLIIKLDLKYSIRRKYAGIVIL